MTLLQLDNPDVTTSVTLTMQQLTDIRVSCLHRLDTIKRTIELKQLSGVPVEDDLTAAYDRVKAMLEEGGLLHRPLRQFIRGRHGL